MSDPAPFDPAALLMVLDQTEATGAPPEMVEYLRMLVRAAGWGWSGECSWPSSTIIRAGVSLRAGDRVIFEEDGRIYLSDQPYGAGVAIRDIREGEFVPYRKLDEWPGFSYEPTSYEFG